LKRDENNDKRVIKRELQTAQNPSVQGHGQGGHPASSGFINLAAELHSKFIGNPRFAKGFLVEQGKEPVKDLTKDPLKEPVSKQYAQTMIKFYPNQGTG
jgi:hypothetical protein